MTYILVIIIFINIHFVQNVKNSIIFSALRS